MAIAGFFRRGGKIIPIIKKAVKGMPGVAHARVSRATKKIATKNRIYSSEFNTSYARSSMANVFGIGDKAEIAARATSDLKKVSRTQKALKKIGKLAPRGPSTVELVGGTSLVGGGIYLGRKKNKRG